MQEEQQQKGDFSNHRAAILEQALDFLRQKQQLWFPNENHNAINKYQTQGVVIFIGDITLLNQHGNKISSIYPRRAKQLVLKGKAKWLKEGKTLQMISEDVTSSSTIHEEEITMTDEKIYTNNGEPTAVSSTLPDADTLLLYKAKQNVKDKKNLAKHALAYVAAWPLLGLFYAVFVEGMIHPRWWSINNSLRNLDELFSYIPDTYHWMLNNVMRDMEWQFTRHYIPPAWYLILGAMLAWGGWIAIRYVKRIADPASNRFRKGFIKKEKPDPIMQEYNRLKDIAEDNNL